MKRIKLANGKGVALVDDADHARMSGHGWCLMSGYARAKIGGKIVYMHRLLANAGPGEIVDHINRNPLDNRRANLRLNSASGNSRNMSARRATNGRPCSSRYKGVYLVRTSGRWRAQVMGEDGKRKVIGSFTAEVDAARAYDRAAIATYGDSAATNVMLGLLPPLVPDYATASNTPSAIIPARIATNAGDNVLVQSSRV